MTTLFYGLNIGKNTLRSQTSVINTVSHNIANANTPGYSRQQVNLIAVSDDVSGGRFGGGVKIGAGTEAKQVTRSRFRLYDDIYRNVNQNLNFYRKTEELVNQIEFLFAEPSDNGLGSIINDFFNGWHEAGNDTLNVAARQSLHSIGEELTSRMHRIYDQLLSMQSNIDNEISKIPVRLNEISSEIARLNSSIRVAGTQGQSGNDLRDKRDLLIDEMSDYVDIRALERKDGTYTVIVGSSVVVEQDKHNELSTITSSSGTKNIKKTLIVSAEGNEYEPTSGKLGALIHLRDSLIPSIQDKMNIFSEALVNNLNFEHRNGYGLDGNTNRNFFDPTKTKAFNISLSKDIDDVANIAVSGDGTKGDNSNALQMINFKNKKIIDGIFDITEYYNALISDIGIMGSQSRSGRQNEELLVAQVDSARESIKGVSIDEELINLIQAQFIYQAASRLIVVLDELLETVINLT